MSRQVISRRSVLTDISWCLIGSCTSEFLSPNLEHFFETYVKALESYVAPASIDKELWREEFYLSFAYTFAKTIVALGGLDANSPGMIDLTNMMITSVGLLEVQYPIMYTFRKFKSGELLSQKKHPELLTFVRA